MAYRGRPSTSQPEATEMPSHIQGILGVHFPGRYASIPVFLETSEPWTSEAMVPATA